MAAGFVVACATSALVIGITTLGFTEPAGASSGPAIYISNYSGIISSYALPSTGMATPLAVNTSASIGHAQYEAFDASGDLWVSNSGPDDLVEFTPSQLAAGGTPTAVKIIKGLDGPAGIAFNGSGDLWVAEAGNDHIVEFTPSQLTQGGSLTPAITVSPSGGALTEAGGVAFDGSGDLWVGTLTGSKVIKFTAAQIASSGSPAPSVVLSSAGFSESAGLAFDDSGNLWVANRGFGEGLFKFTPSQLEASGSPTPTTRISGNDLASPVGVAFDSSGNLWVTNQNNKTVVGYSAAQLTSTGTPSPKYLITGSNGAAQLPSPFGVALADPPPSARNLAASISGFTVSLRWTAPLTPARATDYQVTPIINGVAQTPIDTHSSATSFSEPAVASDTYAFTVSASNVFGRGPTSDISNSVSAPPLGYDLAGTDGGVFVFPSGGGFFGSLPGLGVHVNNIVGIVPTDNFNGYDLVGSDGGVFVFPTGSTGGFFGSLPGLGVQVNNIVGIVAAPDGGGYFLVGSDGGVFTFGDAKFFGSLPGQHISVDDITGIASTPTGQGYYVVSETGTVYAFGDAQALGSLVVGTASDIVSIVPTPNGGGYWLIGANGGVYPFGNAPDRGSLPALGVNVNNVVGAVPTG
jgi:hypothetical protein